MSSYKELTSSPAHNFILENAWNFRTPSYDWTAANGSFLLQSAYPQAFSLLGKVKNAAIYSSNTFTAATGKINDITIGSNTVVIVGENGYLANTNLGITSWTTRTSGTSNTINGIAYGNNTFVYVDQFDNIFSSGLTAGSGGGGGGGGGNKENTLSSGGSGGNGALYGGGGGGGGQAGITSGNGGNGANGSIIITYTTNSVTKTVHLISGTTWIVPADWTDAGSIIRCIGGGGGGARRTDVTGKGGTGGGGGGAYAQVSAIGLTAGNTVYINIGSGGVGATTSGGSGGNGGDTWLNKTTNAAPTLTTDGALAKGGSGSVGNSGGAGGSSATSVGTTKFAGGNGGSGNSGSNRTGGGGGGSAASNLGVGGNGGGSGNTNGSGGGGGGGTGGNGSDSSGVELDGANGGNGYTGTAGGIGDANAGNDGTFGGGGAGGAGKDSSVDPGHNGGAGGSGTEYVTLSSDVSNWTLRRYGGVINTVPTFVGSNTFIKSGGLSAPLEYSIPLNVSGGVDTLPRTGDVVILAATVTDKNEELVINQPETANGYTQIYTNLIPDSAGNEALRVWVGYKIMGAIPDTRVQIGYSPGAVDDAGVWAWQIWRNINSENLFNVTPTSNSMSTTSNVNPPAITTTSNNVTLLFFGAGKVEGTVTVPTLTAPYLSNFKSAAADNNRDLVAGTGSVFLSTPQTYDGAEWGFTGGSTSRLASQAVVIPLNVYNTGSKIFYANDRFLVSNSKGIFANSINAISWNTVTTKSANDISSIVYANNKYFLSSTSELGSVKSSNDSVNWTQDVFTFDPIFVGSNIFSRTTSTSSITIPLTGLSNGVSSSASTGDYVFLFITEANRDNVGKNWTDMEDQGYTTLQDIDELSVTEDTNFWCGYKVMGATPDTSVTLPASLTTVASQLCIMKVWRPPTKTQKFNIRSFGRGEPGSGTQTMTWSAVYYGAANSVLMLCGATSHNDGLNPNFNTPSYLNNFLKTTNNVTNDASIGAGWRYITGPQTYVPGNWTWTGGVGTGESQVAVGVILETIKFNKLIYENNTYVGCGDDGVLVTSSNGNTWTTQTSQTTEDIQTVFFGENEFSYFTSNGTYGSSSNAVSWTTSDVNFIPIYVGGNTFSRIGSASTTSIPLTGLSGGASSAPRTSDIVIVAVASADSILRSLVLSSDYTTIASLSSDDTNDTNLFVGYKIMGATPDTSVTIPATAVGSSQTVAISVWRNAEVSSSSSVSGASGINTVIVNPAPVSTTKANSYILVIGAGAHTQGTQTYTASYLSNFSSVGKNDSYDSTIGIGSILRTTAGVYDPAAWTFSSTDSAQFSFASVSIIIQSKDKNIKSSLNSSGLKVITYENFVETLSEYTYDPTTEFIAPNQSLKITNALDDGKNSNTYIKI